jgi:tRNA threonylcarbamoyladenosine biosynthesis protein TsaE
MGIDDSSECSGRLQDDAATQALGAALARAIAPGLSIRLQGDLGAGKTTLTRALLVECGYRGRVKSPTYTLVESYPLPGMTVHHFDLYRFTDPQEWDDSGFSDYFAPDTVCLIEWPDKAGPLLPAADIELRLDVEGDGRCYHIRALTETGLACLNRLSTPAAGSC